MHLLVHVMEKALSGSIVLSHDPDKRTAVLALDVGKVTKVKTSEPVAFLGRVLVELGYLSDDGLARAEAELGKGRLAGKALLASGLVNETQLRHALRVQQVKKLEHCFSMPDEATFGVFEGFQLLEAWGGDIPAIDPMPTVWRAVLTQPPSAHVEEILGRLGEQPIKLVPGVDLGRLQLAGEAACLAELLRVQAMRLKDLEDSGVARPALARLLAYALLVTRQASPGAPEAKGRASLSSARPPPATEPPTSTRTRMAVVPVADSAPPVASAPPKSIPPSAIPSAPSLKGAPTSAAGAPAGPAANFARAEVFLMRGDFASCEAACKRAVEADPSDARYLATLAWAQARLGADAEDAIELLGRAIELDAACARAFFYRGMLYRQIHKEPFALRDLRRAAELDPTNVEAVRIVAEHERRGRR